MCFSSGPPAKVQALCSQCHPDVPQFGYSNKLSKQCVPHQWGRHPSDLLALCLWHRIFLGGLLAGLVEGLDEVRWRRET